MACEVSATEQVSNWLVRNLLASFSVVFKRPHYLQKIKAYNACHVLTMIIGPLVSRKQYVYFSRN